MQDPNRTKWAVYPAPAQPMSTPISRLLAKYLSDKNPLYLGLKVWEIVIQSSVPWDWLETPQIFPFFFQLHHHTLWPSGQCSTAKWTHLVLFECFQFGLFAQLTALQSLSFFSIYAYFGPKILGLWFFLLFVNWDFFLILAIHKLDPSDLYSHGQIPLINPWKI